MRRSRQSVCADLQHADLPDRGGDARRVQVTVSATGPVTTPASIPLSFKSAGKLSELDVSVGQTVIAGQVLAKLETTDLQIAVDQAQAALTQQQANLATVLAGATR